MAGRSVLLVGAYERDNFGDLLFLELTRERLLAAGAELVVSAPISADMRELVGEHVLPTGLALQLHEFDVIWVVGGEVGTTTLGEALRFSLTESEHEVLAAAPKRVRTAAIAALTHDHESPGAYVPDPAVVEGAQPRLVLHSVGVAGLAGAPADDPRMATLTKASRLTVRDNASSELMSARGVRHRLAPDLVHTIRSRVPDEPRSASGRVLVQASTRSLDAWGDDAFVDAVATIAARWPVTLFAAGTANAHDSLERYETVRRAVVERSPDADVEVSSERDPVELVRQIARSLAWVGTSLHGRIVASAFDLPRVSLANVKVAAYAATWDTVMPADVAVEDAPAALEQAFALAHLAEAEVGTRLADLAEASWQEAVSDVVDDGRRADSGALDGTAQDQLDPEAFIALAARLRQGLFDVVRESTRAGTTAARRAAQRDQTIRRLEQGLLEQAVAHERLVVRAEVERVVLGLDASEHRRSEDDARD